MRQLIKFQQKKMVKINKIQKKNWEKSVKIKKIGNVEIFFRVDNLKYIIEIF
jgi:hypothetical protein